MTQHFQRAYVVENHSPHAHTSTGFPYGSRLRTSGDRYPGVPANPGGRREERGGRREEVGGRREKGEGKRGKVVSCPDPIRLMQR